MNDIPMNNRIRESLAQFRRAKAIADETRADMASEQHSKAMDSMDLAAYVLALAVSAAVDSAESSAQRLSLSQRLKLREVRDAGRERVR